MRSGGTIRFAARVATPFAAAPGERALPFIAALILALTSAGNFLPLFAAIGFFASLGPALCITVLNVKYRDFRYVIPFIVQLGLYVSPVGFSSNAVPHEWRLFYSLNPMVGVIDGFSWCLLGGESRIFWPGFWLSLAIAAIFVWLGIRQFRRMEKSFADLI